MFQKSKYKKMGIILFSYFIFTTIWGIRENYINFSFLNTYCEAVVNFLLYGAIWLGFSYIFTKKNKNSLVYKPKELLMKSPDRSVLLVGILVIFLYQFVCWFEESFTFHLQMNWLDYMLTCLGVGIFEESVFRGCFFNMLNSFMNWKYANIISSLLFVFVHYPRWIFLGRTISSIFYGSLFVFILGFGFGYVFHKTKSIWTSAILHSFWDALAFFI